MGYIGITAAFYQALRPAFDRMLAEPSLLLTIGNPSDELGGLPNFNLLPGSAVEMPSFSVSRGDVALMSPRDPSRRWYAEWLSVFAYTFLVAHEFSHIVYGHLRLISEPSRGEVPEYNGPRELNLKYQAMEVDADLAALNHVYSSALNGFWPWQNADPAFRFIFEQPESVLFAVFLSVYIVHRFFHDAKPDLDELDRGDHPAPTIRQGFMIGALVQVVERDFPQLRDRLRAISVEAIVEAENAIATVRGAPCAVTKDHVLAIMYDERAVAHANGLEQRRSRVVTPPSA